MMGLVPLQEEARALAPRKGNVMWGHSKKETVCKLGREPSLGSETASTLILDFPAPELWEINFCCLRHPPYGIFVAAAQADEETS